MKYTHVVRKQVMYVNRGLRKTAELNSNIWAYFQLEETFRAVVSVTINSRSTQPQENNI